MSLTLNIKLGSQPPVPVQIEKSDKVWSVKHKLCIEKNLDPEKDRITILFQGKELADSCTLQDSDLCDFTVLHAILRSDESKSSNSVPGAQAAGLNIVSDLTADDPADNGAAESIQTSSFTTMYYVYCKSQCQKIQPGRIRVRCVTCKQGTLQLNREPSCWNDVLRSGQIHGKCHGDGCIGDTAEFFFKCNGHPSLEDESSVVLHQIVANIHQCSCLTCGDLISPVLVFSCDLTHVMCLPCFEEYCTTRLNERSFVYNATHGYTLGCPAGCENSMIEEAHHFKVLGKDQYDRYQRFATEECLVREGGVLCPAPGCGEGLFPGDVRRVQCARNGCMFVFCKECHREYHEGDCNSAGVESASSCQASGHQVVQQHSEDLASLQTITKTTKPCPKCKVPVEKTGGCMHMVCSRCDFEWCWLCCTEWTRDCQGAHWFG